LLDDGSSVLGGGDGWTTLGFHSRWITLGSVAVCSTFSFTFNTVFFCEGLGTSSLFSWIFFLGSSFFFCSFLFFLGAAFCFGSSFCFDIFDKFFRSWGWISTSLMP